MNNDPHGLILSLVSVCTVFLCLLILYGIYSLVGKFFSKKNSTHEKFVEENSEAQDEAQIAAVIAVALELYQKEDKRKITINSQESAWGSPERNFRRYERL
ncbi:MAG: OadG family transporter subunit [Candidatus Cryptobacteroides sp.]